VFPGRTGYLQTSLVFLIISDGPGKAAIKMEEDLCSCHSIPRHTDHFVLPVHC
jgi:hypothetical protein